MSSVESDARALLAVVFGLDAVDIPADAGLESYSRWDSLAHMRIVLYLEEVIGRPLETEEILEVMDMDSIQQLLDRSS
jgi:acyl carrier protein